MLTLMGLMILHSWSQSRNVVSPIEVLLGTPRGPSSDLTVISRNDITVYMHPDATDLEGTLSLSLAEPDPSLVADNTGWLRPKIVNIEFQTPNGVSVPDVSFAEPLEICFNLNQEQWDVFQAQPGSFEVQHYATRADPPGWEVLPQVTYPDRLQVCGQSSHLSLFSLAVKPELEVPVTGPTATLTLTPVSSRTPLPPVQTQENRRKKDPTASAPQVIPTNQPPTSVPPTEAPTNIPPTNTPRPPTSTPRPTNTSQPPTQVPPTQVPPTQVPPTSVPPTSVPPTDVPTDPPPTDPPATEPPATEPPAATSEPTSLIESTIAGLLEQWISPGP